MGKKSNRQKKHWRWTRMQQNTCTYWTFRCVTTSKSVMGATAEVYSCHWLCWSLRWWQGYRSEGKASVVMFCFHINAKRTCSTVRKFILKRSEHVFIDNLNIEAKRSKLILNCESSEAKRTCSIVTKFILELYLGSAPGCACIPHTALSSQLSVPTCTLQTEVNYGGRSPKFIWAPCHVMCTAVLTGWDPATPSLPPAFGLVLRGRYWSSKIDDISL